MKVSVLSCARRLACTLRHYKDKIKVLGRPTNSLQIDCLNHSHFGFANYLYIPKKKQNITVIGLLLFLSVTRQLYPEHL